MIARLREVCPARRGFDRGPQRRTAVAGMLDAAPRRILVAGVGRCRGVTMMVAGPRPLLLAGPPASAGETDGTDAEPASPADWERACIEDGEPTVHPETAGNLDAADAESRSAVGGQFHEGLLCRPGNRRAHPAPRPHQAPHAALCGACRAPFLRPGSALYSGDAQAAQVVAACDAPGAVELLAVTDLRFCSDLLGHRSPAARNLRRAYPGTDAWVGADRLIACGSLSACLSCGNNSTSRMLGESVSSITRRSMPTPSPAAGGMPYSSARI